MNPILPFFEVKRGRFTKDICPCVSSESMEVRQRSYELGIHLGHQRRNKDVIAWVKKRRRTIRREDLISFLCGKVPPPRTARAPPRVSMVSASRPSPPETGSSVETDLQPFREAIALHGAWESRVLAGSRRTIRIETSCSLPWLHIYFIFLLSLPSRPQRCDGGHFCAFRSSRFPNPPGPVPQSA